MGQGLHDKRNLVKQLLACQRMCVAADTLALLLQALQDWLAD